MGLLVAGPGVGKSALALYQMLASEIPELYVSCDTTESDQAERAMAYYSGQTIGVVREDPDKYHHHLNQIPRHCAFEFDSEPEAEDIMEMAKAYKLVFGFYPWRITVDTIGKVWSEVGDEVARNKEAVKQMQDLARLTGAHVQALHHAQLGYDSGDKPIPLNGIMGGTTKIPEMIATAWNTGPDTMAFCPVKNRNGPSDATAMNMRAFFNFSIKHMRITPIKPITIDYSRDPELG